MKALTPLRGVAAMTVLLFHAGLPIKGYLCVDLFFILSGFVLMHAYGQMAVSGRAYFSFLKARLARIYPVHLLVLVMLLPMLGTPGFGAIGLIHSLLLTQSPWYTNCWNFASWSISAEWHAYLAFPFLAVAIRARSKPALVLILIGCGVVVSAAMLVKGTANVTYTPAVFLRLFAEFVAGMVLYRLRGELAGSARNFAWFGVAAAIVAAQIFALPDAVTICLLPGLLIYATKEDGAFYRILNLAPLRYLGEISYSLYMVHMVVVVVAYRLLPPLGLIEHWALFVLGPVALAIPVSLFVEMPARQYFRQLKLPSLQPIPVPAA
ncbi:MAG TPA: acyltransferase [Stellaceae bacterium]|jgi:peptidoglycan/LPS O-acetylase OafA/YrhL|nr:acyltransferase [Stellaceae bacterium]